MILRSGNRRIVKMLTKLVVVKSSSKGLGRREAPEQFSVSLLLVTAECDPSLCAGPLLCLCRLALVPPPRTGSSAQAPV